MSCARSVTWRSVRAPARPGIEADLPVDPRAQIALPCGDVDGLAFKHADAATYRLR